jgi:hypothetical protein
MARIDGLAPEDRALRPPRRSARADVPSTDAVLARRWRRCLAGTRDVGPAADLFARQPDGYLRFRRSLLRDAAYEGLPYKLRRRLHGAVAAQIAQERDYAEERRDPFTALPDRRR